MFGCSLMSCMLLHHYVNMLTIDMSIVFCYTINHQGEYMSYKYQDPEFPNLRKIKIGDEQWIVSGVWFTSDDPDGRHNARTSFIGIKPVPPTKGTEKKLTKDQLKRAINNGRF